MGVTIDEAGKDRTTACVLDGKPRERGRNLGGGTDPRDTIAVPRDRRVADDMDVGLGATGTAGGEESDVREERQFPTPLG